MVFSKPLTILNLISITFFVHAQYENLIFGHKCFGQIEFLKEEGYAENLKAVLTHFTTVTHIAGNAIVIHGRKESNQTVSGLAKCWGLFISPRHRTSCKRCIRKARQQARRRCPHKSGAIIWAKDCFLKYSRIEFLGISDTSNQIHVISTELVDALNLFNSNVHQLLIELCLKAPHTPQLFAHENLQLEKAGDSILYGATQCTMDLLSIECEKCLHLTMNDFLKASYGRKAGFAYNGSCHIRFKLYSVTH